MVHYSVKGNYIDEELPRLGWDGTNLDSIESIKPQISHTLSSWQLG